MSLTISITIYAFTAFGIAWGVGHSGLSYPVRLRISKTPIGKFMIELLECVGCIGWHTGVVACALGLVPGFPAHAVGPAIVCGFFTAASNLLLGKITGITDPPA